MANCKDCGSQWDKKTAPVGSFKPNPFGLYDTADNVWEWVEDWWHENYSGAPADGSAWTTGGDRTSGGDCGLRVVRGGSWTNGASVMSTSYRFRFRPVFQSDLIGFRLVQDIN